LSDLTTPSAQTIRTSEAVYERWQAGRCERDQDEHATAELHPCHRCGRVVCNDCCNPTRERRTEPLHGGDHEAYTSWVTASRHLQELEAELERLHNLLVYEHGMTERKRLFGLIKERVHAADGRPWAEVEAEIRTAIRRLEHVRQTFTHEFPLKFACVVRTSVDYRESQDYVSRYSPYLCHDCRTEADGVGKAPAQPKGMTTWED